MLNCNIMTNTAEMEQELKNIHKKPVQRLKHPAIQIPYSVPYWPPKYTFSVPTKIHLKLLARTTFKVLLHTNSLWCTILPT